jgi:ABC-2 type transport system ATP-binding protein
MGKTVLLSSHILSELAEVCSEIGIMEHGTLLASGTVDEVRRQLQGASALLVQVLRDPERAAALLREIPGVAEVRADERNERLLRISGALDEEQQAALLAKLLAAGIAVSSFHVEEDSLEMLFLRLTED